MMERPSEPERPLTPVFMEVIGRALIDPEFRQVLFEDRDKALAEHLLDDADRAALDSIDRGMLEEHARHFDRGSATAIEAKVVVKGTF